MKFLCVSPPVVLYSASSIPQIMMRLFQGNYNSVVRGRRILLKCHSIRNIWPLTRLVHRYRIIAIFLILLSCVTVVVKLHNVRFRVLLNKDITALFSFSRNLTKQRHYGIVLIYSESGQKKTSHTFNEIGKCPLITNVNNIRRHYTGDIILLTDSDSHFSALETNLLEKLGVSLVLSDAVREYNSTGSIQCNERDASLFPPNMLKQDIACLPYKRLMYLDIDNFIVTLNSTKLFEDTYPNYDLVGWSGATSPLAGAELLFTPDDESCSIMKEAVKLGFSPLDGWLTTGPVVEPWETCRCPSIQLKGFCDSIKLQCTPNGSSTTLPWNFFASCADQGLLYYNYHIRKRSAIINKSAKLSWDGALVATHYWGNKKPWKVWRGTDDAIWWSSWDMLLSKFPEVESLHCHKELLKLESSVLNRCPGNDEYFSDDTFGNHACGKRLLPLLNPLMNNMVAKFSKVSTFTSLLHDYRIKVKQWHFPQYNSGCDEVCWQTTRNAMELKLTWLGHPTTPRTVQFKENFPWEFNPYWKEERDAEWIWALNRQPFWIDMAKAYNDSKDERIFDAWKSQFISWISVSKRDTRYDYDWGRRFDVKEGKVEWTNEDRQWPNPKNVNQSWSWRRIDAGARGERFPFILHVFIQSVHFDEDLLIQFLNSVHEHGQFLSNNPYRSFTVDNHGLFEANGALSLGIYFSDFKDAQSWREKSLSLLCSEIPKQILPDGGHIEGTFSYLIAAINLFTKYQSIMRKMQIEHLRCANDAMLCRSFAYLKALSFSDNSLPQFNDDGVVMHTPALSHLQCKDALVRKSMILFEWSGMFASRWVNSTEIIMKFGPAYNAHSHLDAGTFSYMWNGIDWFPDSGCYTYADIKERYPRNSDRKYFISSAAHQTVVFAGENAHVESRDNGWYSRQYGYDDCGLLYSRRFADSNVFIIENRLALGNNTSHRRTLLHLKEGGAVIVDEIFGDKHGELAQIFNLAPGIVLEKRDQTFLVQKESHILEIASLNKIEARVNESFISHSMGQKVKRKQLQYVVTKNEYVSIIITSISPEKKPIRDFDIKFTGTLGLEGSRAAIIGLTYDGKPYQWTIEINQGKFLVPPPYPVLNGNKELTNCSWVKAFLPYYCNFIRKHENDFLTNHANTISGSLHC